MAECSYLHRDQSGGARLIQKHLTSVVCRPESTRERAKNEKGGEDSRISPPVHASASPTASSMGWGLTTGNELSVNGNLSPISVSQPRGSLHATGDKHSRNKILSAHPMGEFGAAYRRREPGETGIHFQVTSCEPGDEMLANRSLARSGLFLRSLCARDPIQGGKQSRNLICPGSGTRPTPDPSDRWPESLEEERLSRITGPPSRSLLTQPVQVY